MNDPLFPAWTAVIGFVIGAFIGSFLNMVIYRLPRNLSFSEPKRSFCPRCQHSLEWIDLFPIFSWLSTGGKCRYCKEPVAPRYLFVELLTGSIFAGIWFRTMSSSANPMVPQAIAYALMAAGLVAVIFIDWELYIIPDELNAFLLVVGVGYSVFTHQLEQALYGALLGWGLLWGIALLGRLAFGKDAMGHGDIKMMRGVGALIGPLLVLANLAIAVVLGLVIGVLLIVLNSKKKPQVSEDASKDSGDSEEEELYEPESIGSLIKCGVIYLLCIDILGIFVPKVYGLMGIDSSEELDSEEEWEPSYTTIPFGPYLAAGAIVCILFAQPIEKSMREYWKNQTGSLAGRSTRELNRAVSMADFEVARQGVKRTLVRSVRTNYFEDGKWNIRDQMTVCECEDCRAGSV